MVQSVDAGARVTIEGEEGIWDVSMPCNGFPIVRVILESDPVIWKVVHTKKLELVSGAAGTDGPRSLVPTTNLFD